MNSREFAAAVLIERARLALIDPEGEADAVAPLSPAAAYERLRLARATAVPRESTPTSDDRDLLRRLGADLGRTSGRLRCPAHGGKGRNLAWRLTPEGRALLKCHSHQCSFTEIVAAVR